MAGGVESDAPQSMRTRVKWSFSESLSVRPLEQQSVCSPGIKLAVFSQQTAGQQIFSLERGGGVLVDPGEPVFRSKQRSAGHMYCPCFAFMLPLLW